MLHELEMSVRKLNFSEKLDKSLPSFKERTINLTAIHLCQNMKLKKDIIFESELQRLHDDTTEKITEWNSFIIQRSTDICQKIPLPLELQKLLIARFQSVVLQLLNWYKLQAKFDLLPRFADSLLTPSDWTVEGRLDEKKIAVRLVRDERITACQRFKMACFHCIESSIYSLWNQVLVFEDLFRGGCMLVDIWSKKLTGVQRFRDMGYFWSDLCFKAVYEGSMSTVFHLWDQARLSAAPIDAICVFAFAICEYEHQRNLMHFDKLSLPVPCMDILYFVLTRLPKEDAFVVFTIYLPRYNILAWFVQWPYLDILIPIIKELWGILPVVKYGELLLILAHNYSDEHGNSNRGIGYVDYDYANLMIELLEESPDHFKRYLFNNNHQTDINPIKILYIVIRKKNLNYRNIKIFHSIWRHVTLQERRTFLKSEYGELFCCCLARNENLELLDSLLKECLPKDEVTMFQNKISEIILNEVDEEPLY